MVLNRKHPVVVRVHVNTHFIKMAGESALETVVHYTIFVLDVYSRVTSEN